MAGNNIIEIIKRNKQLGRDDLRKQYVKVLFANLFEVVKTVGTPQGWIYYLSALIMMADQSPGFLSYSRRNSGIKK
ncbi:MAG: hypothetical protein WKF59_14425 [Chitinophagaceae bacterium]